MGDKGWHSSPWKGILTLLQGENTERPPVGYLPDRGKQKQRNHRWLGDAWHLLWHRRNDPNNYDPLILIFDWSRTAALQELNEGLGVHAGSVEIFMPDPHTAYDFLPLLVFLCDAIDNGLTEDADKYRTLIRWRLYGWQAGSTPDGQVVLPCTRLVTPLSQVADACNRFVLNLPHRNNKWEPKTWNQWFKLHKENPTAQLWVAEYFRRALEKYGREGLLQLESQPELEPPLLAWPIHVDRREDYHEATMQQNTRYSGIEPCFYVRAAYGTSKRRPTDDISWTQTEQIHPAGPHAPKRMLVSGRSLVT